MADGASAGAAAGGQSATSAPASTGQQSGENTTAQGQTAVASPEGGDVTGEVQVAASFEKTENTNEEGDDFMPTLEYIRKQFADEQFDDDEKVDRKAYKHIKELESYREKNREANKKVMQLFNAHPELISVLQDMDKGASFREALARNIDTAELTAQEGDPDYDAWTKAKTEREAKFQERQKWSEEYAKNRKESADTLKKFAAEKKLDQPALEDFAAKADDVLKAVYAGKVDMKFLNALYDGITAKDQIAQAAQVAEVKGKNAAITEKVSKASPEGDGLPDLSKGGEAKKAELPEGAKMLSDLVDTFNTRRNKF